MPSSEEGNTLQEKVEAATSLHHEEEEQQKEKEDGTASPSPAVVSSSSNHNTTVASTMVDHLPSCDNQCTRTASSFCESCDFYYCPECLGESVVHRCFASEHKLTAISDDHANVQLSRVGLNHLDNDRLVDLMGLHDTILDRRRKIREMERRQQQQLTATTTSATAPSTAIPLGSTFLPPTQLGLRSPQSIIYNYQFSVKTPEADALGLDRSGYLIYQLSAHPWSTMVNCIGEMLFARVLIKEPSVDLTAKYTGMFLDAWSIGTLVNLLESDEALIAAIQEAKEVLESVSQ